MFLRYIFTIVLFFFSQAIWSKPPVYVLHDGAFDDIFALMLVLADPDVNVKHIVIEPTGETTCEKGLLSTLGLLRQLNKKEIEVSCGPAMSLSAKIHGIYNAFPRQWQDEVDVLNAILWSKQNMPKEVTYARIHHLLKQDPALSENYNRAMRAFQLGKNIEYLATKLNSEPEKVHVLELGPMVTPAALVKQFPDCFNSIAQITLMGGAFDYRSFRSGVWGKTGNIKTIYTPSYILNENAEWNIYAAPLDAGLTLQKAQANKIPVHMIPLNVTSKVKITTEYEALLANMKTWKAEFSIDLLKIYRPQINAGVLDFWDSVTAYIFLENIVKGNTIPVKSIRGVVGIEVSPFASPQKFYQKYKQLGLDRFYKPNLHDFINTLDSHQQWAKITTNEAGAYDTYGETYFWPNFGRTPKQYLEYSALTTVYTDINLEEFRKYFVDKHKDIH